MPSRLRFLLGLLLSLPLSAVASPPAGNGTTAAVCQPVAPDSNTHAPPQLYAAMITCLAQQQVEPALPLYLLGSAYGRFDRARVADSSAHQATTVLEMELRRALGDDAHDLFLQLIQRLTTDADARAPLCRAVAGIGPPHYHPQWMLDHGMGAFVRRDGPVLTPDFDAATAWQAVLDDYLKCRGLL